jgi:uncharacterized protein YcbX
MFNLIYIMILKHNFRCLNTTIDQQTGIRDTTQEPWKTLQTYLLSSYFSLSLFVFF